MRIYVVIFPESDEGCATFSTIEAAAECIRKELEEAIDDTMTREEYNDYVKALKSEINFGRNFGCVDAWICDYHLISSTLQ